MRTIIAFGHRKRVGKDLCAEMLCGLLRSHGLRPRKAAFADKLKDICYQLYSWAGMMPGEYYEQHPEARDRILPAIGKTPRQILIDFGTPAVRHHVFDGTWVEYLLRTNTSDILIISDLRFPNEVEAVRKAGGLLVKVNRPSVPHSDDVADVALAHFEGWDRIIHNNGAMADLFPQVEEIANTIATNFTG